MNIFNFPDPPPPDERPWDSLTPQEKRDAVHADLVREVGPNQGIPNVPAAMLYYAEMKGATEWELREFRKLGLPDDCYEVAIRQMILERANIALELLMEGEL